MSSAVECFEVGAEGVVGLTGDVALEAAEDLASVEPVGGASNEVELCNATLRLQRSDKFYLLCGAVDFLAPRSSYGRPSPGGGT